MRVCLQLMHLHEHIHRPLSLLLPYNRLPPGLDLGFRPVDAHTFPEAHHGRLVCVLVQKGANVSDLVRPQSW